MTYAKIENGAVTEYPVYEGDIRLRYPNVSFSNPFEAPEGYEQVFDTPYPVTTYRQNVEYGEPVRTDGKLYQSWIITDASDDQIAEREASIVLSNKAKRNQKLSNTDWTQLADVPLTADCKTAFAAYRQALRDLDMLDPTWPDAPAEEWVA